MSQCSARLVRAAASPGRSGRARGGRCRRSSRRTGSRRSAGRCRSWCRCRSRRAGARPRRWRARLRRYSSPRSARGLDDLAVAERQLDAVDVDAAGARADREADRRRSAQSSCGPVKTSPLGHVALAVGVDPGAALDAQRQVGALGLDAQLARVAQPLDQRPGTRRSSRPRGDRVGLVEEHRAPRRTRRSRRAPSRPLRRRPGSATASSTSALAASLRALDRLARAARAPSAPGRRRPARRVSCGAWMPQVRRRRPWPRRSAVGSRRAWRSRACCVEVRGLAGQLDVAAAARRRARGSRAGARAAAASASVVERTSTCSPRLHVEAVAGEQLGEAGRVERRHAAHPSYSARRGSAVSVSRTEPSAVTSRSWGSGCAPLPITPMRHTWPAS